MLGSLLVFINNAPMSQKANLSMNCSALITFFVVRNQGSANIFSLN